MHCSLFSRLGAASVLSACLCAAVAMFPATGATANELYNFKMSPGGWISGGTPGWEWSRPSPNSNEDSWKAFCTGIVSTSYLYSPCLEVRTPSGTPAGRIDVDFEHRFRFEDNPGGTYPPSTSITNPQGAGQVQFMLNNSGIWQGIKTWDSGGSEIVPQFFSGSPTYVPPLANPGLSFVGTSPKSSSGSSPPCSRIPAQSPSRIHWCKTRAGTSIGFRSRAPSNACLSRVASFSPRRGFSRGSARIRGDGFSAASRSRPERSEHK